jgi:molybdopterin-containing oxidoreductase family iron-sulfur binding subunit
MELTRRGFLKMGGLAAIALVIKPVFGALPRLRLPQAAEAKVAKRWAMAVRTGVCPDGCTACRDACHLIHNVPDFGNPKDEVKWIWTVPFEAALPEQEHDFLKDDVKNKPVVILCNHCDNPPCVRVCPTKATFKREDGIVMMDYHRCIGCRYCMAACPYGSRSFNWRDPRPFIKEINPDFPTRTRGVVEKCNFCQERLAQGLIPACVEACPEKALIFGDLEDPESEIRTVLADTYSVQRKPGLGTRPQIYYMV